MMKIAYPGSGEYVSLHNHSEFSDGAGSLSEICRAGKAGGLKVLGISDHWVNPPVEGTDYRRWSMDHARLDEYVETLQKLKKELDDENFTLKIGLEVDFFYENHAETMQHLAPYNFDYLIGSVHYSGIFSVDGSSDEWLPLSEEEKSAVCDIYWDKLEGAAACGDFSFIGHLDLPKKFALIDNLAYIQRAVKVLDIIQQHNGAFELNTSGWFKNCREQYPAFEILQAAAARNIPVVISADAHCAEHLQRNFAEAKALLKQAGYIL